MDRTLYFGSADAKDVMSSPPYGCRRALVLRKAGVAKDNAPPAGFPEAEKLSGPMERGIALEHIIIQRVVQELQIHVEDTRQAVVGEVACGHLDWLRATPDGTICALDEEQVARLQKLLGPDVVIPDCVMKEPGSLEAKTIDQSLFWRIKREGAAREDHIFQNIHEIAATGTGWGLVVYLNANDWQWQWFLVVRDREWERDHYIPAVESAWHECNKAKQLIRPADSPDEWEAFLPKRLEDSSVKACTECDWSRLCWGTEYRRVMGALSDGDPINMDGNAEWGALAAERKRLKAIIKEATKEYKANGATIKKFMGDEPHFQGGGMKAYFKPVESMIHDGDRFTAEHPQMAADYKRPSISRPLKTYEV